MKRRFKSLIVGFALMAVLVGAAFGFSACTKPEPTPTPTPPPAPTKMTDGIYISDGVDMGAGRGLAYNYVRFHESGIFYYAQMAQPSSPGGGLGRYAGYWKLVEEEITFEDGVNNVDNAKAPAYIEFTKWDGSAHNIHQYGTAADGETALYDNKAPIKDNEIYGIWYSNMLYKQDLNNTDYKITDETDQTVAYFIKEAGAADGITISHTGKFEDYLSDSLEIYEGNWTYAAATRTYTLTADGKTATLVVSEDGFSAVFNDFKGTTQNLVSADAPSDAKLQVELYGNYTVASAYSGTTRIYLYDDGTAKAKSVTTIPTGSITTSETGTWEMNTATYIFTLTMQGHDAPYTFGGASGFSFNYDLTVTMGTSSADAVVAMNRYNTVKTFKGTTSMGGGTVTITSEIVLYSDKTVKFNTVMGAMGEKVEVGTWTNNAETDVYTITIDMGDDADRVFTTVKESEIYKFSYSYVQAGSQGSTKITIEVATEAPAPAPAN